MQILTTNHPLTISPQGFEGTYEDIRELVIRITLAFTLAAVLVVVVAPVFGFEVARADTAADYSSYYSDPAYYNYYGYGAQGRSLDTAGSRGGLLGLVNR